ncbi:hypothetical protein PTTG_25556 [Puccinia triticina 1-1 BBBD Race 1]|uniref:DNA 3'-5' helicase n=1 Tax=Puccinia triticina (isolate 1-1 / race 1 (BBBD)) TaxID=630390 RepID=A0A180H282_PUCT1|nr:hypothetical protein PTTG_25556 [Puccinia triticina 1-1 BBBD Race 1]
MADARQVMVATSGFGAGINYAHLQLVISEGIPNLKEVNKIYQQIGRAGRDGKEARIELIPQHIDVPQLDPKQDHKDMEDFKRALMNLLNCPAQVFLEEEDEEVQSCQNFTSFSYCSQSKQLSRNLG